MLPIEIKEFFRDMNNPDYLSMKLLSNVLMRMKNDVVGERIVNNIKGFSECEIKLVDLIGAGNSVLTNDERTESELTLSIYNQEEKVAHEFAHLLLDLFSNNELPYGYFSINRKIRKKLEKNKKDVSLMLKGFSEYLFGLFSDNILKATEFVDEHPDVIEEFLEENTDSTYQDFLEYLMGEYFLVLSESDFNAGNFNKIGNVIDASFHGKNPFKKYYSDSSGVISPLVASHTEEYFLDDEVNPEFAGFEEQFAEYLSMKLYGEELRPAVDTLKGLIGNEWFEMMDGYYGKIADRVEERSKIYMK